MSDQSAAPSAAEASAILKQVWWIPVMRGVFLLVLGFIMLANPLWSVKALVWIFGIFAILDGIVAILQWFSERKEPGSGWWLVSGGVSLAMGIVAVLWPGPTASVVFYLIAIWVLLLGVLQIITAAIRFRAKDEGWTWVFASGLVSFLFGLIMITHQETSAKVIVIILGLFAFVAGVLLVVGGFAARHLGARLAQAAATE